jgi:hypothetical protein
MPKLSLSIAQQRITDFIHQHIVCSLTAWFEPHAGTSTLHFVYNDDINIQKISPVTCNQCPTIPDIGTEFLRPQDLVIQANFGNEIYRQIQLRLRIILKHLQKYHPDLFNELPQDPIDEDTA